MLSGRSHSQKTTHSIPKKCPEQGHQQRQKIRAGSGSEEKAGGRVTTKATGCHLGVMSVLKLRGQWLYLSSNRLKATELYIITGENAWYANYISIYKSGK